MVWCGHELWIESAFAKASVFAKLRRDGSARLAAVRSSAAGADGWASRPYLGRGSAREPTSRGRYEGRAARATRAGRGTEVMVTRCARLVPLSPLGCTLRALKRHNAMSVPPRFYQTKPVVMLRKSYLYGTGRGSYVDYRKMTTGFVFWRMRCGRGRTRRQSGVATSGDRERNCERAIELEGAYTGRLCHFAHLVLILMS